MCFLYTQTDLPPYALFHHTMYFIQNLQKSTRIVGHSYMVIKQTTLMKEDTISAKESQLDSPFNSLTYRNL